MTLTNPERSRPHWPLGASVRRSSLEHLAKNSFITFQREGQTWTFGLEERVKGMLGGVVGSASHLRIEERELEAGGLN